MPDIRPAIPHSHPLYIRSVIDYIVRLHGSKAVWLCTETQNTKLDKRFHSKYIGESRSGNAVPLSSSLLVENICPKYSPALCDPSVHVMIYSYALIAKRDDVIAPFLFDF